MHYENSAIKVTQREFMSCELQILRFLFSPQKSGARKVKNALTRILYNQFPYHHNGHHLGRNTRPVIHFSHAKIQIPRLTTVGIVDQSLGKTNRVKVSSPRLLAIVIGVIAIGWHLATNVLIRCPTCNAEARFATELQCLHTYGQGSNEILCDAALMLPY